MPCCCRKGNADHVAVASRADSSPVAGAPKANRMGDRGFEDDKATIQKWRDQHHHQEQQAGEEQQQQPSGGGVVVDKEKRSIKHDIHSNDDGGGDESDSSNTYHLESNENNKSVKVSTEAVQAWQKQSSSSSPHQRLLQQQQQQQQQQPRPQQRDLERLRSPFEVVSSAEGEDKDNILESSREEKIIIRRTPRPQNIFRTTLLDDDDEDDEEEKEKAATAIVTPDKAVNFHNNHQNNNNNNNNSIGAAAAADNVNDDNDDTDIILPPPTSSPTTKKVYHHHNHQRRRSSPRPQRQHDHEGLRDQLIRDVVLKQQVISSSWSSTSDNNNNKNHHHHHHDNDRIRGQVFLKVHHHPIDDDNNNTMISPRSSLDENENDDLLTTTSDDDAVSDIFSDPALEEVANSLANDSESRERYILACRLLRTRIIQPNPPPIMPMERELLQDLRDRFRSSRMGGSAIAYEALSKLLEEDDNNNSNNDVGSSIFPLTSNSYISHHTSGGRQQQQQQQKQQQSSSSYKTTTTTMQYDDLEISHDVSLEGEITVGEEETGFNTVFRDHQHQNQNHHHHHHQSHPPWNEEKSPKAMPQLFEEQQSRAQEVDYHTVDDTTTKTTKTTKSPLMIRLDGWNSSTRIEQYPFEIMGLDQDTPRATRVLTPALMEALRGFFPYAVSEDNFWLKFSLVRDGASLRALLRKVMASQHTIVCVETNDGEVFGSFSSTPWRNNADQQKWFGTGEAFLWKAKQSRYVPAPDNHPGGSTTVVNNNNKNEMEVYPFTGHDDMVQYCTSTTLAVGGGSWNTTTGPCPYPGEPHGIGLLIDGDLEGGETNSCATFANPRLYGRRSTTPTTSNNSTNNEFTIENCEVWTLTPMNTVHAAEQLERQKYFLQEHAQQAEPTSPMMNRPNLSPRRGRPPLSLLPP